VPENNINELISTITRIKSNSQFKRYINYIQFPYYRYILLDTKITFDFPLTIFVGQNGSGKSSTLHALYGAPRGKTPYEFWFDTKIDPIQYYDDQRKRHSFFYEYNDVDGTSRQVIKARIKRENDPNYWETSRPLVWAGMKSIPSGRRNSPIDKNVVYLDFRAELNAFDKYFYFGDVKYLKSKNKQEYLRNRAKLLSSIISGDKQYAFSSTGKKLNEDIISLNVDEIKWISYILGKKYTSAKVIRHSIYKSWGYSIIFQTNQSTYSEAFAGSGESAVVRLVQEVLGADSYSLILLDEPEVSLHPGAQNRLKMFLLEQIKLKKHQVVVSTHSPKMLEGLPAEAIKVFTQLSDEGRFTVKNNNVPEEAFYHIEHNYNKKVIVVEDKLAKSIFETVLDDLGEETRAMFDIQYYTGGCSTLKNDFIKVHSQESSDIYVVFDGDQKKIDEHYDISSLPARDITIANLETLIQQQTGESIKFKPDGNRQNGGNAAQKLELIKKYLNYYLKYVFYLPKDIPENIIWDDVHAQALLNMYAIQDKFSLITQVIDTKGKFYKLNEYNDNRRIEKSGR